MTRQLTTALTLLLLLPAFGGRVFGTSTFELPYVSRRAAIDDAIVAALASSGVVRDRGVADLKRLIETPPENPSWGAYDSRVREYALLRLWELHAPWVSGYLYNLWLSGAGADPEGRLAYGAFAGLIKNETTNIPDADSRLKFLVRVFKGGSDGSMPRLARGVAANMMCDLGTNEAETAASEAFARFMTPKDASDRIEICRAKVALLSHAKTRLDALEAALVVDAHGAVSGELKQWAMAEMVARHDAGAQAAILRYVARAEAAQDPVEVMGAKDLLRQLGAVDR